MSESSKESAAIVLDCRDHGESDLIVTFFCQGIGRMTGIAKGAKRSQKRFVNKLELFSSLFLRYTEAKNSNMAFIVEAELLESFLSLRQNMPLYMAATVIRELTLVSTRDLEGDNGLFSLLLWTLESLVTRRPTMTIVALFQLKFFEQIGYRPNFSSCLRCNQPFDTAQDYGFESRAGSIICSRCQQRQRQASIMPLARGTIKFLESAQNQPLDRLPRLHLSRPALHEALALLYQYGRHLLQREIYSLKTLSDGHWQA